MSTPDLLQLLGSSLPRRGPGWWPIRQLGQVRDSARMRRVLAAWLAAVALSIAGGVLNVVWGWNGIQIHLLGVRFAVTIYPPFLIAVLIALWLGPVWGAIPIYLANLASALASGLSFAMGALFALAGVIETLMLWGSMATLKIDPDLRRLRDLAWFGSASLVAAASASLAAILWNSSHRLDPAAGERVWLGWVVGDLLQMLLLVPVLHFAGPRIRAWLDRQFVAPPTYDFSYTHGVGLTIAAFAILGAVVFLGVHQALSSIKITLDASTASGDLLLPRLREIILVMGLLSTALIVATGMFSTALAHMGERQRREAQSDSLTGCLNRRSFDEQFHKEAERSRRLGRGVALLFVDLDEFKALNDRHGHGVGDVVLRQAARRIEEALRETDLLFRWGGEEFVALLPHTTPAEVEPIAERVRAGLAASPLLPLGPGEALAITASIGGAAAASLPAESTELLRRADAACYEAKRAGRNRVVLAAPTAGATPT
ncbi:MAG: GGDEF domain-containing protein [Acidobacteriota bacterium]